MGENVHTLYAAPHSLYAGRARSYLIKAGIAYREIGPNTKHFHKVVKPLAGGRNSMPTLELPSGEVIRDGAAIIDYFEQRDGYSFRPKTPKQNIFSLLFDVIGAEGLLRPAIHYRWSFDEENWDFLQHHFEMVTEFGDKGKERALGMMGAVQQVIGPSMGVSPDAVSVIEELYADQLAAMDAHFSKHGYLLGGRPSIGDFGLLAPMFGHLGRDPKPLGIMLKDGMRVFRWVERMNRLTPDLCEYEDQSEDWLANDEVPETLINLARVMAEDFVPETIAAADAINEWLESAEPVAPLTECQRALGVASFSIRGVQINAIAQPYRFYLLKRVQDAYERLETEEKADVDRLLALANMSEVLNAKLTRSIGRHENLEVWR